MHEVFLAAALAVAKLPAHVEAIVRRPSYSHTSFGAAIYDLDAHRRIYALNGGRYFLAASTTKLLTEGTTLSLLGPDYRFRTDVYRTGEIDANGTLHGDVVLLASGDPNLSGRTLPYSMHTERKAPPIQVLQTLADQLVAHGLKYVDGDIVADDSYFVWERYGEGWSQDDLAREWGAPVSALTVITWFTSVMLVPGCRCSMTV